MAELKLILTDELLDEHPKNPGSVEQAKSQATNYFPPYGGQTILFLLRVNSKRLSC